MSAMPAEDDRRVNHGNVLPFEAGFWTGTWLERVTPQQRANFRKLITNYDPEAEEAERLYRDAEAERKQAEERRLHRVAGYLHRRPPEYAAASFDRLKPQQNPKNKITGWLESGAKTLLLLGPSGHGKTDAAYSIGNAAVELGLWVDAWYIPELHRQLRPLEPHERYDGGLTASRARAMNDLRDCGILLFDDLGREDAAGWGVERWRSTLADILNHRVSSSTRRNVVSANVSSKANAVEELRQRYGDPIVTRLCQDSVPAWIEGDPLRQFAKWEELDF